MAEGYMQVCLFPDEGLIAFFWFSRTSHTGD